MNAISMIEPNAAVQVTILNARDEFGTGNPVSQGAVALATWFDEMDIAPRASALGTALGGWSSVRRMLADAITPGLEFSELLGHFTDGKVVSRLWLQPYAGTLGPILDIDQTVTSEAGERLGAVEQAAPSIGAIGTIPPGALFRFRAVVGELNLRQIAGLGIAIEGGDAELCSLRDACSAAIADLRGGARA